MLAIVNIVRQQIEDASFRQPLHDVVSHRQHDGDKAKANRAKPVKLGPIEL
jgi:hypothetical protein